MPAQKIGGEWRFLRTALIDWMRYDSRSYRNRLPFHPEFLFNTRFADALLDLLEERLLRKLKAGNVHEAGSKQAVLKHFGVFGEDDDLEDRLADARARRRSPE